MELTFGAWLKRELQLRGMRQADLARSTGLTTAAVAYLSNDRVGTPTAETCIKIARAFRISAIDVMSIAGLEVDQTREYPEAYEIGAILEGLDGQGRRQIIDVARLMAAQMKK